MGQDIHPLFDQIYLSDRNLDIRSRIGSLWQRLEL
jgi:hypothetical protein